MIEEEKKENEKKNETRGGFLFIVPLLSSRFQTPKLPRHQSD
jgi:hypothetical protein